MQFYKQTETRLAAHAQYARRWAGNAGMNICCLQCNTNIIQYYRLKMFYQTGRQKGQKMWFLSLVTLTFDIGIETCLHKGPKMSSLWIWCKSIDWFLKYFIYKQKSHSQRQKQNLMQFTACGNYKIQLAATLCGSQPPPNSQKCNFLGVTQPPGVTQPLHSRGHN